MTEILLPGTEVIARGPQGEVLENNTQLRNLMFVSFYLPEPIKSEMTPREDTCFLKLPVYHQAIFL